MKKDTKKVLMGIVILAIVAAVVLGLNKKTTTGNYDDFAKCLTENNAKMYGAFWCTHCQKQKAMFGDSWQYVTYIECSNSDNTQKEICKQAGIKGYPTWEFKDSSRVSGEVSIVQLSDKSGCSLDLIKT